ncbi:MAG: alpha/beta fold hydrolase [Polyangiales bacterium]
MLRRSALALALCCAAASGCATFQQPGEPLGARLGPDARYVRTGSGRAVYVEVKGEANQRPSVLLVHGFASNHDTWDTLEPALRAGRRTINVDLPGFGWSTRTEGDYSPAALARDLVDVLDALGEARVDVVAHSWGSSVTLALALDHPERVRRVVVIGAWVYDEQIPPFFRWARLPGVGEMLFSGFYTQRPEDRFPAAFSDPSVITQDLVDAIRASLDRPGTTRAALAAARGQCFLQLERRYRTLRQPALLLWGADDNVSRVRFGERLARDIPGARLEVIPGGGHFPMLEAAGPTRRAVLNFLDSADAEAR